MFFPTIRIKDPDFIAEHNIPQEASWRDLTIEQIAEIEEKVRILVAQEAGIDCDGDCPISVLLVNRKTQETPQYRIIDREPSGDDVTDEQTQEWYDETQDTLVSNVRIAASALEHHNYITRLRRLKKRDEAENARLEALEASTPDPANLRRRRK